MSRPLQSERDSLEGINSILSGAFDPVDGAIRVSFEVDGDPGPTVTDSSIYSNPGAQPLGSAVATFIKINNILTNAQLLTGEFKVSIQEELVGPPGGGVLGPPP